MTSRCKDILVGGIGRERMGEFHPEEYWRRSRVGIGKFTQGDPMGDEQGHGAGARVQRAVRFGRSGWPGVTRGRSGTQRSADGPWNPAGITGGRSRSNSRPAFWVELPIDRRSGRVPHSRR